MMKVKYTLSLLLLAVYALDVMAMSTGETCSGSLKLL